LQTSGRTVGKPPKLIDDSKATHRVLALSITSTANAQRHESEEDHTTGAGR